MIEAKYRSASGAVLRVRVMDEPVVVIDRVRYVWLGTSHFGASGVRVRGYVRA